MNTIYNPLNDEQEKALSELTTQLDREGLVWINGYFQGLLIAGSKQQPSVAKNSSENQVSLTILFGTHTGHSQAIATQLSGAAENLGINASVFSMEEYKVKQLAKEENLAIIVSTHGEGEAPDMAEDFYNFVRSKRLPQLNKLNYAVFALGDKSYNLFCQTGIDIDEALAKNGAKPILPLATTDVDYEDNAEDWIKSILDKLKQAVPQPNANVNFNQIGSLPQKHTYSRKNPFYAEILDKVKITGRDSDKEVYHLELSLDDSGINYLPGDSVGILANNPPELVQAILQKTKFDPEDKVWIKEEAVSLNDALLNHFEITVLTKDVIRKYAEKSGKKKLGELLSDEKKLEDYLYGHDVLDLLDEYPHNWEPKDFFELLRNFPARLYSISSSQEAVEDEVHITVSVVNYENKGRKRVGACSSFLSKACEIGDKIPIYIDQNPSFKLPANNDTPIIMVGAGTGVAPYRAFLQHRETANQIGKSWLVFGDRSFYSDFLYQVEWQKLLKKGYLEKLDVAFSREQKEKVYVQHKLKENQQELFNWLENGASFYLCGDMKFMAKDVNKTLIEIIQVQGGISETKAKEYIKKLKKEKRFQVDVY